MLAALDPEDPDSLRDVLAALFVAITSLPERELQAFDRFSEAELATGAADRAAAIAAGSCAIKDGPPPVRLLDATRLIRVLEALFVELLPSLAPECDEDLEEFCLTSDRRHYVLPRIAPLGGFERKPFSRRGLLQCRVIPAALDGLAVRLHRLRALASSAEADAREHGASRSYGAALFPGLSVEIDRPDATSFTVSSITGFDAHAQLIAQLDAAQAAACQAVVWGELTMPPDQIETLRRELRARALRASGQPRYLVADSWHQADVGGMRNAAQVIDGRGEPLFEVLKWARFWFQGLCEAIEPGEEIHILIDEDELTVIAICRDFLQQTCEVPYCRLPVDLAIVPSMTGAMPDPDTMKGHAQTAQTMRVRHGTRTLVVAQPALAVPGAPIGEVLAFPARPLRGGSEPVTCSLHPCILESR